MEDFWARVIGAFLAELADNMTEKVGKILADLWKKRGAASVVSSELPVPYNTPPPLPLSTTPLFGREADFADVLKLLRDSRLVTLTGDGGVGKTALAQTMASWFWETERETQMNPRGVAYVEIYWFDPQRDDFVEYVRQRLAPQSQPPTTDDPILRRDDAVQAIARTLNQYVRLVVFDNFDTVFENDKTKNEALLLISQLVGSLDPKVRLLITSRHALNLRSGIEKTFRVPSLEQKDAINLFFARAESNLRRRETIGDVAEICSMLDNLPLAIELAAAAVKQEIRSPKQVREGLQRELLDLEIADMGDYPERHHGLVASFLYTYKQLKPAAQRLFCIFHVFRNGADGEAIKYVDGSSTWEFGLRELVGWYLVNVDKTSELWRYSMLATTEAFSRFISKTKNELPLFDENEFRQRHAEYYVKVAKRFDELPMDRWNEIEDTEWENIKAGADWAVNDVEKRGEKSIELLLQEVGPVKAEWLRSGLWGNFLQPHIAGEYAYHLADLIVVRHMGEGHHWLGAGIVAFNRAVVKEGEAYLSTMLARWHEQKGDFEIALKWIDNALHLTRVLEMIRQRPQAAMADLYAQMSRNHLNRGNYALAMDWAEGVQQIGERFDDNRALSYSYSLMADIHQAKSEYDLALAWNEKTVNLLLKLDDKMGLAVTYDTIGTIHDEREESQTAIEWYKKSLQLSAELDNKVVFGATANNLAMAFRKLGEYEEAMKCYMMSGNIFRELKLWPRFAGVMFNIANLALTIGDDTNARQYAQASLALFEQLELPQDVSIVRQWMIRNGL